MYEKGYEYFPTLREIMSGIIEGQKKHLEEQMENQGNRIDQVKERYKKKW